MGGCGWSGADAESFAKQRPPNGFAFSRNGCHVESTRDGLPIARGVVQRARGEARGMEKRRNMAFSTLEGMISI